MNKNYLLAFLAIILLPCCVHGATTDFLPNQTHYGHNFLYSDTSISVKSLGLSEKKAKPILQRKVFRRVKSLSNEEKVGILARLAFICGLLGLIVFPLIPIGMILGIIALIIHRKNPDRNLARQRAKEGIIFSSIGALVWTVIYINAINSLGW